MRNDQHVVLVEVSEWTGGWVCWDGIQGMNLVENEKCSVGPLIYHLQVVTTNDRNIN